MLKLKEEKVEVFPIYYSDYGAVKVLLDNKQIPEQSHEISLILLDYKKFF